MKAQRGSLKEDSDWRADNSPPKTPAGRYTPLTSRDHARHAHEIGLIEAGNRDLGLRKPAFGVNHAILKGKYDRDGKLMATTLLFQHLSLFTIARVCSYGKACRKHIDAICFQSAQNIDKQLGLKSLIGVGEQLPAISKADEAERSDAED
ncbi:hypothetical protein OK016_12890 [Vibrio chagasii]|nr:hypothetical protein [Vibrio chagasii]